MKQTPLKLSLQLKKTRKQVFLEQMELVVLWADLVALIAPQKFDIFLVEFRFFRPALLMNSRTYLSFQA
jgi:hypothetical protein